MEGGPPIFRQDYTCPALLEDRQSFLPVRGCHPLWRAFPDASGSFEPTTGLVRVRSPLLAESRLMSFPPGTEMFQFPGFASRTYGFSPGSSLRRGLPHSDICGSPGARPSPQLFAACHVLHRLSVPRHPPDALQTLDPLLAQSHPPALGNAELRRTPQPQARSSYGTSAAGSGSPVGNQNPAL